MLLVFVILYILLLGLLIIVTSLHPSGHELSRFELTRRGHVGDRHAQELMEQERHQKDVFSLQQVASGLLYIAITLLGIGAFHWLVGTVLSIIVVVLLGVTTRLKRVKRYGAAVYKRAELLARWLEGRYPKFLQVIRHDMPAGKDIALGSREELEHLVAHASGFLSSDQKYELASVLAFHDKTVKEVMVPRREMDTISATELLGPLVLDDLHKTGHSLIPVTTGEDKQIVGILHLKDLVTLDKKRSLTAGKAMESRLVYVREDQSLESSLAVFLQEQQQLLVVVNESAEVVGVLSLKDVIASLRGHGTMKHETYHDPRRAANQ